MNQRLSPLRRGAIALALLALGGCSSYGYGGLGDVLGGRSDVRGEITRVDARRQEISIRRSYGGDLALYYDRDTDVLYRSERYSVRALEPGDVVSVDVDRGARGRTYARAIRVERSHHDADRRGRNGDYGGYDRAVRSFSGHVTRVDPRRGSFQFRADDRRTYRVTLPYRSGDDARLRRLRKGDHVRIEGRLVKRNTIELYRFR